MIALRSPTYQLQPGSWPWGHHAGRLPIDLNAPPAPPADPPGVGAAGIGPLTRRVR